MKELKQITVIGLGLLGGSISLAVLRSFPRVKVIGYSHRSTTRRKAKRLAVATEVVDDLKISVCNADVVILATPISAFEEIFAAIRDALPRGCMLRLPVSILKSLLGASGVFLKNSEVLVKALQYGLGNCSRELRVLRNISYHGNSIFTLYTF